MLTLQETKHFLRVDTDEDDNLISSLILTGESLIEEIIRTPLSTYKEVPEPIKQATLIVVGTLYEERQISNNPKEGLAMSQVLDIIKKMLFAYREVKF